MVNPEDTDRYKRLEDVIARIATAPKARVEELRKAEPASTDPPDKSSDAAAPDPRD